MTRTHQEISALIPWYVNGTGSDSDRLLVEGHLALCALCREDLAREQHVYLAMNVECSIEYMPAASLKRLQARLDGAPPQAYAVSPPEEAPPEEAPPEEAPAQRARRRASPWRGVLAASVAVMAVAVSLLAADRWLQLRARSSAPNYHTVTTPTRRVPDEVIRAVFAPTITLVELQAVLDEAGMRIISGPSEAGVYSLAANSNRPVSSSLASLRAHPQVRFAESIEGAGPGGTP